MQIFLPNYKLTMKERVRNHIINDQINNDKQDDLWLDNFIKISSIACK